MTSLITGISSWLGNNDKARPEEYHLWHRGSPDGWYQHSRSSKFSFIRWWKRSLPRHIGVELLTYLIFYYIFYILYRTVFSEEQKQEFEELVAYFKRNVDPLSKDLAFLLGFFVKAVVSRWWTQYTKLPNPDSFALQIHGLVLFDEKESEALHFSHTCMRYLILSYVLAVRRISKVVQDIFSTSEELMKARLITREELDIIESEGDIDKVWWIPLCWAQKLVNNAKNKQKIIPSDHKELIRGVVKFKEALEASVENFDHIPLPPVYSQVVYIATYSYFILALVGYQELSSEPELFFPFFLVLKFIFFIGWLKVASAINNPFGDDEDDFQVGELISRHVWAAGKILTQYRGPPIPPNWESKPKETMLLVNSINGEE